MFTALNAALFIVVGYYIYRQRQRSVGMKEVARRFGMQQSGFPATLQLAGTSVEAMSSFWNLVTGELGDREVAVFDCRIGRGKASWSRTVIAVKGEVEINAGLAFSLDLTKERTGDWTILFSPQGSRSFLSGVTRLQEIEALLELIQRGESTGGYLKPIGSGPLLTNVNSTSN